MITISKHQLNQVEYLIGQSILGNHILFDTETIRQIFEEPSKGSSRATATTAEQHIEKLILQPTIAQKRAYLEKLDSDTFKRVVKTYFSIVENNLFEQLEAKH